MGACELWEAEDNRKEKWLQSKPICCICGEHIQDEKMIYHNGKQCCPIYECEWEFWQKIREDFLEDAE